MSATFKPHLDILPSAQKRLWPALKKVADLGFVLYGGTAIALRLGHRSSVDFDFFIDRPLEKQKLRKDVPFLKSATVLQDSPETLTALVPMEGEKDHGVKISFFSLIGFGRVGEPEQTEDGVLWAASLNDLLALKLSVILQRVEAKDYLDIAAMVKSGLSIELGVSSARALYGPSFQPSESLKALTYFEGGDLVSLAPDIRKTLVDAAGRVRDLPAVKIRSPQLL
jgi:Nucleotidyl transferase AbiEii toxin, Type IV TA system